MQFVSFGNFELGPRMSRSPGIKSCGRMVAYQAAGIQFSADSPVSSAPSGSLRGSVLGFSSASALRFRRKLLMYTGTAPCYAVTLTLRDFRSPADWRRCLDRFSKRISRTSDCGFWRVELQRRGTPHLHCLAYSHDPYLWRKAWLDVWGLNGDRDHELHACKITCMHGTAWLNYVASHATKHKGDQLGWAGRQWGVFNKSRLISRDFVSFDFPYSIYKVALDSFRGWCLSRSEYVPRSDFLLRFDDDVAISQIFLCADFAWSDLGIWYSDYRQISRLLFSFSHDPAYHVPVSAVLRFMEFIR